MARRIRNNSSAPEVFRLSRPSEGAGQVGACARAPNALQHGRGTLGAATRSAPDGALAKQLPADSSPLVKLARLLAREAARASQEGSSETLTPMLVGAPNCNRNTLGADSRPKPVAQALTAPEVLALRDRAGLSYATLHHHFGHRFVLAGEKGSAR